MGFRHVEDKGSEEINTMYFKNRKDGLQVGSLSHLMNAQVWDGSGSISGGIKDFILAMAMEERIRYQSVLSY